MTTTPPPKTGMPTWLKVLLVLIIIIILGCCGIFTACYFFVKPAVQATSAKIQEGIEKAKQEAEKQQADARKRLEEQGKGLPELVPTPSDNAPLTPTAPAAPGAPATPTPTPDPAIKATRLPANFPSDVPTYPGFVPTFALADKTAGSGSVIFTGKGSTETISAAYEKQLQDKGWKQESSTSINDAYIQSYSKDDRTLTVSVTPETDGKTTLISIGYSKK